MKKYLITGNSGSGKSTMATILSERGYKTIDADNKTYSCWIERSTGREYSSRPVKTPDWIHKYDWAWRPEALSALLKDTTSEILFVCGTSANQADFYRLFDRIFLLSLDKNLLPERLFNRPGEQFGKIPSDVALVLGWHELEEGKIKDAGAIIVDASQPPDKVADEIESKIAEDAR